MFVLLKGFLRLDQRLNLESSPSARQRRKRLGYIRLRTSPCDCLADQLRRVVRFAILDEELDRLLRIPVRGCHKNAEHATDLMMRQKTPIGVAQVDIPLQKLDRLSV